MNIETIENGFTSLIHIGIYSNILYLNKEGVSISIDEIYNQCEHYNSIIVCGINPLLQKEELSKLFKRLVKNNTNIRIELHTTTLYKPIELSGYKDNITFYVSVPLRRSGIAWPKRINDSNLTWYAEIGARFLFKVQDQEEIEEVRDITKSFGISKSQVYLIPTNNTDIIKEHTKRYGYNLALEVEW